MKLLLIGGTGFVGTHIQHSLHDSFSVNILDHTVDIRNAEQIKYFVNSIQPDIIIHLAAQSFVPESFKNPQGTFEINFTGTLNLLMALEACNFHGRMLYVGSAEVYGLLADDELPVSEDRELKPRNPYAVSKLAAEALCYQWSQTAGFEIIMARPFNHIGPGQSEHFAISNFSKQIVEIKLGLCEPVLKVGDIEVTRDFTDVRDIVTAYMLLLERGKNGEVYNVCSGKERSVYALIMKMMEIADISAVLERDNNRLRPSEQHRIFGSFAKLQRDTGWEPRISIDQTLKDILNDWERRIS